MGRVSLGTVPLSPLRDIYMQVTRHVTGKRHLAKHVKFFLKKLYFILWNLIGLSGTFKSCDNTTMFEYPKQSLKVTQKVVRKTLWGKRLKGRRSRREMGFSERQTTAHFGQRFLKSFN